jgi:hypothetical protein
MVHTLTIKPCWKLLLSDLGSGRGMATHHRHQMQLDREQIRRAPFVQYRSHVQLRVYVCLHGQIEFDFIPI